MIPLILAVFLAVLPQYTLPYHVYPGETYGLVHADTLNHRIWTGERCGQAQACDSFVYAPAPGIVEQLRMSIHDVRGDRLSNKCWTLLTLDWSRGNANYSTFTGTGAMQYTLVIVLLPSPRWTVVYSYEGAIPVYVKATCDFDDNGDGWVNLSDFVVFGIWYVQHGKPLNELANIASDYGATKQEWR